MTADRFQYLSAVICYQTSWTTSHWAEPVRDDIGWGRGGEHRPGDG
ncbi:hypothetical protein SBD_3321 [Streptomyces bottropensis ATCC 25435]|uniref:Uncharacterized protein n=1 Tax=Streptomyces bottropensis ATCC 25435 TaxID=1054862 RepID=M3F377_9ACTN|nr:hypothetical protein SBD_3321 [Streptomyces bottropensis ATCC 25435]